MDLFDLTGKTAAVTGAASDIGRRLCFTLANAGAHVIGFDMVDTKIDECAKDIAISPGSFEFIQIDLTDMARLIEVCKPLLERQNVDILINSARFTQNTLLTDFNPDVWDKHFEVNTKVTWVMTQFFATDMISKSIKGSIINIASMNGDKVPTYGRAAYCASKAAIIQISKQLVSELSEHGIRINSISPGMIYTSATADNIERYRAELTARIPLGFIAEPKDLDGIILFLACNQASRYVTGANFVIDGGMSANCF